MGKLKVLPRACDTCPYRRDTPSGLWAAKEYEKLPEYDEGRDQPALSVFLCHQSNATGVETVCRGWLSVHRNSIAVRLAQLKGEIDPTEVPSEPEPLYYESGAEACKAGKRAIKRPSRAAKAKVQKLLRKGAGRITDAT